MLPDIGAGELLLIGIVALVVVGPKDLPMLMRRLGQFTARLRGMAAEFRASFDEMGRQSELDDLRKEVEALRSGKILDDEMGRTDAQTVMREIEDGLAHGDIQMHPPMSAPYAGSQSLAEPGEMTETVEPDRASPGPAPATPKAEAKAPRARAIAKTSDQAAEKAPPKPRASRAKPAGAKSAGDKA
ncbi:MAG: Sec-independent protein translocase protein TatB [Phenylobacterium sp.]|nr:Sec-independent protein translocase protein TatB [Phenylobacterium sp.]